MTQKRFTLAEQVPFNNNCPEKYASPFLYMITEQKKASDTICAGM